jgi:hypothetical protein
MLQFVLRIHAGKASHIHQFVQQDDLAGDEDGATAMILYLFDEITVHGTYF